jgi:hypothetical protein
MRIGASTPVSPLKLPRAVHVLPPLLAALFAACADPVPAPDPAVDLPDWHVAGEEHGLVLAWRPLDGQVRRNQDLDLVVRITLDGVALPEAEVRLRGWMPDHGHGFVQQPLIVEEGDGAYRVVGVRLHMRGSWELYFDVRTDSLNETVRFDLEV